ncbi:hypothetical protein E2C01_065354 [Portunus trituberculatus]|uniref:Uncharacterized protein n=1 Tax=Portunus trituberculatus TaxID=210409 RepID=A0A5B7HRG7_PORTR|nr:hypothetical protein [Portunus trituberculatus]
MTWAWPPLTALSRAGAGVGAWRVSMARSRGRVGQAWKGRAGTAGRRARGTRLAALPPHWVESNGAARLSPHAAQGISTPRRLLSDRESALKKSTPTSPGGPRASRRGTALVCLCGVSPPDACGRQLSRAAVSRGGLKAPLGRLASSEKAGGGPGLSAGDPRRQNTHWG